MAKARQPRVPNGSGKPYGYVLILRVLARAAIVLPALGYSSALRVLCVMAEYADQKGACHPSMQTIGNRLGISRQAVGKHVAILCHYSFLEREENEGRVHRYQFQFRDAEDKRYGQERVGKSRAEIVAEMSEDPFL